VIPEYSKTLEEADILENAFQIVFAFDEIVALGYRESVNLAQIRYNYNKSWTQWECRWYLGNAMPFKQDIKTMFVDKGTVSDDLIFQPWLDLSEKNF